MLKGYLGCKMRVENWNPHIADNILKDKAMERLMKAAYVLKDNGVQRLRAEITGKPVIRPVYKKGPYAGAPWTARRPGELLESWRVVRKVDSHGKAVFYSENVRVYVGHFLAYYAQIFESKRPFFRPAFESSLPEMRNAMGVE